MQFVDLHAQHQSLKKELDTAIEQVITNSSFIRGPNVDDFESNFAELLKVQHCVSCANGTDAIYISLRALGVKPGDEVITTAHSWISTSETITQAGAKVVFCDTEKDYYCIDPAKIEACITEKTKGIVAVHIYGQAVDMDAIMAIANKHDLWVVEDCAQAHLAEYKGKTVGTIGDVGTFSFYPGKNLGAMGDAGCLITNRNDIAEFSTLFARHGGKNTHLIEGINSRLDGLQAAILNVKMCRLKEWNSNRQKLADRYSKLLASVEQVTTPLMRDNCSHVFHLYVIRCSERDNLKSFLAEHGIPTVINYPRALPFYEAYDYLQYSYNDFPIAHHHAEEILSLPMHPFLTEEEQNEVVSGIKTFFSRTEK